MASRNAEAVRRSHDAFNRRDWDAMRALVADDCVFVDAQGESHKGPDGFVDGYSKAWTEGFSDGQVTDARIYDAGDTVVTEFVGRGTNDGPLGPLAATGRRCDLPYVEIYHFDSSGKICGGAAYFDQVSLLTQLGHMES